jgi:hypothetical protein
MDITKNDKGLEVLKEELQKASDEVYGSTDISEVGVLDYDNDQGSWVEGTYIPKSYDRFCENWDYRPPIRRWSIYPFLPYGPDNNYPNFLLDLREKSINHKRSGKTVMMTAYGKGLRVSGENADGLKSWLLSKGMDGSFFRSLVSQMTWFGGCYVIFRLIPKAGGGFQVVPKSFKIPKYQKMRIGRPEDVGSFNKEPLFYWYHPNFVKRRGSFDYSYLRGIPKYRGLEKVDGSEKLVQSDKKTGYFRKKSLNVGHFCYMIGDSSLSNNEYPEPVYQSDSSFYRIQLDVALAAMDFSSARQGLSAGHIIRVPLENTSRRDPEGYLEKKKKITSRITSQLTGEFNKGRALVMFKDPRSMNNEIEISEIPNSNTTDMRDMLNAEITRTISLAWGIPNVQLSGSPPPSSSGSLTNQGNVLEISDELLFTRVSEPQILTPLHEFFDEQILPIFEHETGARPGSALMRYQRSRLFAQRPSDDLLLKWWGGDEIRAMYGSEPMTEEVKNEIEARRRSDSQII